jgi:hypothetical protein
VGGPTCEFKEVQGLLKESGSAEPWILDPTAEKAVDRAVVVAHESTVDRPHNPKGYAIPFVHHRSHDLGRVQAGWRRTHRSAAARGGGFTGAALDHAVGHHFVCMWALRLAGANAHTPRGSRERLVHPWRPTPKGGGAGLAGVRAPVLRHAWMIGDGGKLILTTKRQRKRACWRGRGYGSEDW